MEIGVSRSDDKVSYFWICSHSVYETGSGKVFSLPVVHYPYTKDDELRKINAHLDESIGALPVPAVKLARIISSQCHKLGINPSMVTDLV